MMELLNKTKGNVILTNLAEARSFWARSKGLLGTATLDEADGLWIHQCNSIHMFGMKYAIDCIFLDSEMRVKRVVQQVRPWKLVLPVWGATSVVELKSGLCGRKNVEVGDQLHVGH